MKNFGGQLEVIDEGESYASSSIEPNYHKKLMKRKAHFKKIMEEAVETNPGQVQEDHEWAFTPRSKAPSQAKSVLSH